MLLVRMVYHGSSLLRYIVHMDFHYSPVGNSKPHDDLQLCKSLSHHTIYHLHMPIYIYFSHRICPDRILCHVDIQFDDIHLGHRR